MPVLVTNDNTNPVGLPNQRKMFTDSAGILWRFYSDGTDLSYRTSSNSGATWSAATTVVACTSDRYFAVWYDPAYSTSYVWYVRVTGNAAEWPLMCRGTIAGTSITWNAGGESTVTTGASVPSGTFQYPVIIVLSDGTLQVYLTYYSSPNYVVRMYYNTNNDGSGNWTVKAVASANTNQYVCAATPLTYTDAYVAYTFINGGTLSGRRWDGGTTAFLTAATLNGTTGANIGGIGICSDGDITYVVFGCDDRTSDWTYHPNIQHRTINADNTLGTLAQISADDDGGNNPPDLACDVTNNIQVAIWGSGLSSNDFRYVVYEAGAWGVPVLYDPAQSNVYEYTAKLPWKIQTEDNIPFCWNQGTEMTALNIYFYMIDLAPAAAQPIGNVVNALMLMLNTKMLFD